MTAERVAAGWLRTALWADSETHGGNEDAEISPLARAQAIRLCRNFLDGAEALHLDFEALRPTEAQRQKWDMEFPDVIGHNLYLTQQRHGTGFWDSELDDETARFATGLAHALGEVNLSFNEDGTELEAVE